MGLSKINALTVNLLANHFPSQNGQTSAKPMVTMVIHTIKSQKLLGHITPPFQGCSSHPRYIGGKWVDNKKAKLEYFPKKVATSQHDSTLNIFP